MAVLVLSIMPMVLATDVSTGITPSITTEQFKPLIWMCDSRALADDPIEAGTNGASLLERVNNYAFTGESMSWKVLVMDKNKIEQISDVVGTIGPEQGAGNDVVVECTRSDHQDDRILDSCNARIGEETLHDFNANTMSYYDCKLTVTPSMHGKYFITIEAKDSTGLSSTMDENENFFLNPTIALSVDGALTFEDVRPGTVAYSSTLLVGNDAEAGSGVLLDMYISGTDFYDPSANGAVCSDNTNKLSLSAFRYYATNGAYSTKTATTDSEGYLGIPQGDRITQTNKIMLGTSYGTGTAAADVTSGNALAPGAQIPMTFRLSMPEPCVGDFSDGSIMFWGEAI